MLFRVMTMHNTSLETLLQKAITTPELTHEELIQLLSLPDEQIPELMQAADTVRKNTVGDEVHLRGIIEFSSYCKQHCA